MIRAHVDKSTRLRNGKNKLIPSPIPLRVFENFHITGQSCAAETLRWYSLHRLQGDIPSYSGSRRRTTVNSHPWELSGDARGEVSIDPDSLTCGQTCARLGKTGTISRVPLGKRGRSPLLASPTPLRLKIQRRQSDVDRGWKRMIHARARIVSLEESNLQVVTGGAPSLAPYKIVAHCFALSVIAIYASRSVCYASYFNQYTTHHGTDIQSRSTCFEFQIYILSHFLRSYFYPCRFHTFIINYYYLHLFYTVCSSNFIFK